MGHRTSCALTSGGGCLLSLCCAPAQMITNGEFTSFMSKQWGDITHNSTQVGAAAGSMRGV